jgi:hypothetical protein
LKPAAEREREQKKVMTEENAATLRDALGSVLGQLVIPTEPTPKPAAPKQETPKQEAPKPAVTNVAQASIQHETKQQQQQEKPDESKHEAHDGFKEVPREVLEAALRVDDIPPTA